MDEAGKDGAGEQEKRRRGEGAAGDGRRTNTGGRRKDGGERVFGA
jgi:hypothetical protein